MATATSKTRVATTIPVVGWKDTILKRRGTADNASRVARWYQEAGKAKADTVVDYTSKSRDPHPSEHHHSQPQTTYRALLGRHQTGERRVGEVLSGSKPIKPGKRNMLDVLKTLKIEREVAEMVVSAHQSSAAHVNNQEEVIVKLQSAKRFARWKTQSASVSVVDESVNQAMTALTASVTVTAARVPDSIVMGTSILNIAVMSRAAD